MELKISLEDWHTDYGESLGEVLKETIKFEILALVKKEVREELKKVTPTIHKIVGQIAKEDLPKVLKDLEKYTKK